MKKTFQIEATMEERWIPHFVAMLKSMEYYGNIGRSRRIAIYSDGDGDFRPKFRFVEGLADDNITLKEADIKIEPKEDVHGNLLYDAG